MAPPRAGVARGGGGKPASARTWRGARSGYWRPYSGPKVAQAL